jgi:hypothetical protein
MMALGPTELKAGSIACPINSPIVLSRKTMDLEFVTFHHLEASVAEQGALNVRHKWTEWCEGQTVRDNARVHPYLQGTNYPSPP